MKQQTDDQLDARLAQLAEELLKKRDEAVEARAASGIERQWREDQRAFEGLDGTNAKAQMIDFATGDAWIGQGATSSQNTRRSKVIINIIRSKCETAEGRFSEIVLPTDDKNWGMKETPVPQSAIPEPQVPAGIIQGAVPPDAPTAPAMAGQPPAPQQPPMQGGAQPPADPVAAQKADIKKRCAAMEQEISDQLEECEFNTECRKAQRSAVRLGTGVLKGPNVVKSTRKAWVEQSDGTDSVYVMKTVENFKPGTKNRDIWNIFPNPNCGSDPKRGAYIWDRDYVLQREIKALIGLPGYKTSQLLKVLAEDPVRTTVIVDKGNQQKVTTTKIDKSSPYEKWEYYGEVDKETLQSIGVSIPDDAGRSLSACIVFINDRPVKVQLNSLDSGELPFDFFQWVQVEDHPWGIGEPRKLIWQQRVITAAWRAMMDNAGDSAGPQIIIGKDVIPENGVWEISGKKIWVDESEDSDVSKAFMQYQVENNQKELQAIIDLALKFVDMESGTPMLAQGEKGSAPETLGGMEILMGAADTTRRRQVKQWDDQVTRPHIRRYYDWNMQYNKKQEIKGDFEVDPRGTSVLLVKDTNVQKLMQVIQLRADPEVNLQVDWGKVIKQLFDAQHLDVLKSDEEIEKARAALQSQPPQPPLPLAVEELKGKNALAEINAKAQADLAIAQQEMEHEQGLLQNGGTQPHQAAAIANVEREKIRATAAQNIEASRSSAELARAQKEQEIASQNGQFKIQELQLEKEIALLKYATESKISLNSVRSELAQAAMNNQTKRELAAAEIQLNASENAQERAHTAVQNDADRSLEITKHASELDHKATVHHDSLVRDVMQTPVTP